MSTIAEAPTFAHTDDTKLVESSFSAIVIGLLTNTCVEATVRYAAELGYKATVVEDATASLSAEEMNASLRINMPSYATVASTRDVVDALISPGGAVGRAA